MKEIKKIHYALIVWVIILVGACTDFDDLNVDPTRLDKANPGNFLNPVLYGAATYNWSRYNDYTFALMQCKVSISNTNGVGWYYVNDGAGDGSWATYYRWLNNIRIMEEKAIELNEPNYRAIAIVLRSWLFQILTDAFGNVPMSEACRGSEQLFTPRFDDQKEIYRSILNDLKEANTLFDTSAGLRYNQEGELLYGAGPTASDAILKWKKFCNSLRLRVLLRVIDVSEFNAPQEIRTMFTDRNTYPLFESNADAALLPLSGVAPQEAPLTRPQDFTSYIVLSEFFIDNLKAWNDPRLPLFANRATNAGVRDFVGLPSGYAVLPSFSASSPNQGICIAPMKICLMGYAEVEFILAELAQRGIINTDANAAYENGIKAAIEQWDAVVPADYFDSELTRYDGTLERIHLQKFFALFFCDYQQWFEHNRTGYPVMPRGDGVPSANKMPKRFKYPATLQRTNMKNYQDARNAMGGDDLSIKLFWQK
ncbi:MAG: SusD/RagB family nutrient-binding outer membrane lipoprotein [Dysgonamonadaceae bacterium]|jgi:hypothetical protein|nr:SusD/RagB family nutrient-binding outer membrane lipoprotein [Dysgonamonadaceae bacterium]